MANGPTAWAAAAKDALPWLALIAFVVPSALGLELSPGARQFVETHGVATVILLAGVAYVPRFLRAHQELADAVREFTLREDDRFREIIIGQKVLLEELRGIRERCDDVRCLAGERDAQRPSA